MLDAIERTARSAAAAWRRSRAIEAGLAGLTGALFALVLHALALELGPGLQPAHLPPLLAWLLLAPGCALVAALRPIDLAAAAAEADARAGLSDRLGTALEFASTDAPLVATQRADAAAFAASTSAGSLFPVPWGRHLPRLVALLVLALGVTGAGLTFQLRPASVEPEVEAPDDDLLASIDRAIDEYEEVGDKEAVRLLTDLDRTIRQIRARETRLRKAVQKKKELAPEPDDDVEPEALPPAPKPREDRRQRITADDLARLEEETVDQLAMTDAQQADMVADLFAHTRTATEMMHEFHHHEVHEAEVSAQSANAAVREPAAGQGIDSMAANNQDLNDVANLARGTNSDALQNHGEEREDMIRRDLSDEAQAAHDRAHDTQESFNQFLRDFVKDVQDIVAEAAVGKQKKKNNGKEVQVNNGQGVEDKSDAMAESGFEEMGDSKRHSDAAPPEDLAGLPSQPGQGPPPEGAQMKEGSGTPEGPRMQGDSGGETSAGAQGAGSGNPNQEDGLAALLHGLKPQEGGRLEQALGQLAQGRMPPDVREQLLDRVARHKVQAGLASEADDVLVDYFADAEDLMVDHQDTLPPLFRDYARSYFDSIKPGGSADAATP